jgi:hypothetical protein
MAAQRISWSILECSPAKAETTPFLKISFCTLNRNAWLRRLLFSNLTRKLGFLYPHSKPIGKKASNTRTRRRLRNIYGSNEPQGWISYLLFLGSRNQRAVSALVDEIMANCPADHGLLLPSPCDRTAYQSQDCRKL